MTIKRVFTHTLAVAGLVALAACETTSPSGSSTSAPEQPEQQQSQAPQQPTQSATDPAQAQQGTQQGAPVAIFVAATTEQPGWHPIELESGNLYLNPEPVVIQNDLTGVQAGAGDDGIGLLALELNPEGQSKVQKATSDHPNMRLALIVGQTLLAAPGYAEPVMQEQLVFAVGSEDNANAVARAIAGVPEDAPAANPGTGAGGTSPAPASVN